MNEAAVYFVCPAALFHNPSGFAPPPPHPSYPPPAGFSGAELANVVNEAALLSARRGLEAVAMPELLEAVYRTKWVAYRV